MKEVDVQRLKSWQDLGEEYQLVDVREEHEYDIANIQGELIPLGEIEDHVDRIAKDRPVVIHCRSGKRSADAIELLESLGEFDNLYNLKGGILAWADEIDETITKY